MNTLDLDSLRGRWAEQGLRIDAGLRLDVDAVRASLQRRTSAAFAWHRRRRMAGLVTAGICLLALLAFAAMHRGDWPWLVMVAVLMPMLALELAVDFREWRALRHLDLSAPLTQVRSRLTALRRRRLVVARAYLLFSLLLWWPFVMVLVKALSGVDLLRALPPSFLWVNLVVGLAFIPVVLAVSWWLARRFGDRPGWQHFLDDAAGSTWRRASDRYTEQTAFEAAVTDGQLDADAAAIGLPADVRAGLGALRRHLLAGILGCVALAALFGLFNMAQGGQPRFLAPGLLLLWTVLAHMIVQILGRQALADPLIGVASLHERLAAMAVLRRRVARVTIVLSPILLAALAVVLGRVLTGFDPAVDLPAGAIPVIAMAVLPASLLLGWRAWRNPAGFAPGLVRVASLGFVGRARRLLAMLPPSPGPTSRGGSRDDDQRDQRG